jgi:D-beta-D-heptose 7-phosphate kinase / D-beta-D-heptose 1-phosphate adenosyltransferase
MIEIQGTVVVVGDVMLDVYIHGEATRLSPEAPVPIVNVASRSYTLGGAGNVALNLSGLGCSVHLLGMRGEDTGGSILTEVLDVNGINHVLYTHPTLPTTTKTRVLANHQQLIRFDDERINGCKECHPYLREALTDILPKVNAVILSDYGKGVLSQELIYYIITSAAFFGIPVLVDPKYRDWSYYRAATIIKPNTLELERAAGVDCDDDGITLKCAEILRKTHNIETVIVTRGTKGMMVVGDNCHENIPTVAKDVFDVSGAGDTVIATMAACLCSGYSVVDSAHVANVAAGIVVGKLGTSPITIGELNQSLSETM